MFLKYLAVASCLIATLRLSAAQSVTICDSPYVNINGICYYFSPVETTLNWIESREACVRDGGLLAILDTEEKNNNVANYLTDNAAELGTGLKWIGLTDREEAGTYIWDGIDEETTYTNFYATSTSDRDCIVTSFAGSTSEWTDYECTEVVVQYICQKVGYSCQLPFIAVGTGCYLFYTTDVYNWVQAHNYCNGVGSSLLSIDSEEENSNINEQISDYYGSDTFWIGGYDEGHEGKWYWDDSGHQMRYTNWKSGAPDGGTAANCAITGENGWDDEDCTALYFFICEMQQS